jgi:hypothetical protein
MGCCVIGERLPDWRNASMFTLAITVTPHAIDTIKGELTRTLPHVKSSHRCEAIGRGLGFGTYASLRAAIRPTDPVSATVGGVAFTEYLRSRGFEVVPRPLYHAAAKVALRHVAKRISKLTLWGIGVGRPQRKPNGKFENAKEHYARFAEAREELESDGAVTPFLVSLALLERVRRTKTVRDGTGSYWLKHIAENYRCTYPEGAELGPHYVPNGAFVAAAIHAGFRFKSYVDEYGYDHINVNFNMSKPALVDLDCEIRPDGAHAQDRQRKEELRYNRKRRIWPY